jgi:hypothetical protein
VNIFSSIPSRTNGVDVEAGWFNSIKLALIEAFGDGNLIGETEAACANTQAGASVAGLIFDSASIHRASIMIGIYRKSTTTELSETVHLEAVFKPVANAWSITELPGGGDDSGVDFEIHATTGQVTYTSTTVGGTYDTDASKFTFTARMLGA